MRKAGAVGAGTWPGRVWPGTRMAGRMGGDKVTVENLKVVKVDNDKNLLFVKGAVPGPSKSIVYIEKQIFMDYKLYSIKGSESSKKLKLNKDVFGIEPNEHCIYLAVKS